MICDNIKVNNDTLFFNNFDVCKLAKKYGTPLYLMDENKIRQNVFKYKSLLKKYFGNNAIMLYASKACSFKYMYKIMQDENVGIDVVSIGELWTAKEAGFDLTKVYFHSNNKTDYDIQYGIENNIGYFVIDNIEEANILNEKCCKLNKIQKVLLRITPGIDIHTYEAIRTGQVDSKFGIAIETGQALNAVEKLLQLKNINLCGFHCHVGSQVFDEDVFVRTAKIMISFFSDLKSRFNFETQEFNIGGGFGVRYIESDKIIDLEKRMSEIAFCVNNECKKFNIAVPKFIMEPGRSIVADAGMTVYTVGNVKKILNYKNYVSVDGGMTDNPRFALYGADYTIMVANKINDKCNFKADLVGRCCESGDIIKKDALFPNSICRYDIIAVATTGAYNYSMSSNYNRIPRPPVVMLKDDKDFIVVNRESLQDLVRNDV